LGRQLALQALAIFPLVGCFPAVVIRGFRVKSFAALIGTESIVAFRGNAPALFAHLAQPDLPKITGFGQSDQGYHRVSFADRFIADMHLEPPLVLVGYHSKNPSAACDEVSGARTEDVLLQCFIERVMAVVKLPPAPTCAPSRCCWGIATWRKRRSICISPGGISAPPAVRWMHSRSEEKESRRRAHEPASSGGGRHRSLCGAVFS